MKSNLAAYQSYKSKPKIITNQKHKLTASEENIMKIREKYKPKLPDKKPICPNILVKRIRPENIKINHYLIEEQAFGLKPFAENELEQILQLKGSKKKDSSTFNTRITEWQASKIMHDMNYFDSFKNKTRIIDLLEQKKLNKMFKNIKK